MRVTDFIFIFLGFMVGVIAMALVQSADEIFCVNNPDPADDLEAPKLKSVK